MSAAASPAARDFLPSRGLPLLYLATGLASLAAAFAVVGVDPAGVAGFFYHPRMLAVVHLVTLGWIGGSVLGSIHIVGPLALRMPLRATRGDLAGFAAYGVGMLGMVSHSGWTRRAAWPGAPASRPSRSCGPRCACCLGSRARRSRRR